MIPFEGAVEAVGGGLTVLSAIVEMVHRWVRLCIQTVTWLRASLDIPDLTTSTTPRRTVREGHFPDRVYYYSSIFTRNRRSIIQNTVNLPEFPFFESSTTPAATTQRFSICAKHTLNCPRNPPKIYINFGGQGYITLHPRDRVSPNRPRNSCSLSSPICRPHPPVNTLTQQVLSSSSHLSPTTLLSTEYCCPPRQSSGPPPPPLHIPPSPLPSISSPDLILDTMQQPEPTPVPSESIASPSSSGSPWIPYSTTKHRVTKGQAISLYDRQYCWLMVHCNRPIHYKQRSQRLYVC